MIFHNIGSDHNEQRYIPGALDKLSHYDKAHLMAIPYFKATINKRDLSKIILETEWTYRIYNNDNEIFNCHNHQDFVLTDLENYPQDDQLKQIVNITFLKLTNDFNLRKKGFACYEEIRNFTPQETQKYINQLFDTLGHLLNSN